MVDLSRKRSRDRLATRRA